MDGVPKDLGENAAAVLPGDAHEFVTVAAFFATCTGRFKRVERKPPSATAGARVGVPPNPECLLIFGLCGGGEFKASQSRGIGGRLREILVFGLCVHFSLPPLT